MDKKLYKNRYGFTQGQFVVLVGLDGGVSVILRYTVVSLYSNTLQLVFLEAEVKRTVDGVVINDMIYFNVILHWSKSSVDLATRLGHLLKGSTTLYKTMFTINKLIS